MQETKGISKLLTEKEDMLAKIEEKYRDLVRPQYDIIFSALIQKMESDPEFDAQVALEHKSFQRCYAYMEKKALEMNGVKDPAKISRDKMPRSALVTSDMLFEWIDEYYALDDLEDVQKEEKAKEAEAAKKAAEAAKKAEDAKAKKAEVKKKETWENAGQMSLFDM